MNMTGVYDFDSDVFRNYTLEGNWDEVAETYRTQKRAWKTKIDGDRGTALHVAVNDGSEDNVKKLIDIIINYELEVGDQVVIDEAINIADEGPEEDDLEHVLKLKNELGNTPLHLAASRGFKKICKLIIGQNGERKDLIKERNNSGETPLFLAALSWQKQTFAYLFKHFIHFPDDPLNLRVLIRDLDNDTILHSAIRREFFDLAFIIIKCCPKKLYDIQNKKEMTPLKLLANRPSAFRSGSILTWWRRIIYHCIVVQEIDAEKTLERYYIKEDESKAESLRFPENYRTCYEFFISWFAGLLGLGTCKNIVSKNKGSDGRSGTDEHINICIPLPCPQRETSQSHEPEKIKQSLVPPNYATCSLSLKDAYLYVLGLTGAGIKEMRKIKKKHIWGGQLLRALMETPSESYMGSGGQPIVYMGSWGQPIEQNKDETDPFTVGIKQKEEANKKNQNGTDTKQEQQEASKEKTDPEEKVDIKETAFLIAAKNGIVEMVKMILFKIPSALHDTTTDKKNVFHVAIKNRQPLVVETLLKSLREQDIKNMIEAVDKDENTVLHLAAEQLSNETPWKIPGSAMQMMWDITWFQYIKKLVPEHFVFRRNNLDKTSGELFKSNHKDLVKESSEWLKETSESCSVVAALIAGVSFATSGTVPGGTEKGKPLLEDKPAFKAFAISSLIGLCFSVTALIMFLSILTSRKQAKDFRRSLPQKLLLGLTSLFISIVALFASFCTGHFFVLKDKYREYVFPIYIATCLPVTFYAIAQFPLYLDLLRAIIRKVPLPSDKGDGL